MCIKKDVMAYRKTAWLGDVVIANLFTVEQGHYRDNTSQVNLGFLKTNFWIYANCGELCPVI